MKIFGINFGRKKKVRPKKQKKNEPNIPPLVYSTSFFETKQQDEKIKKPKDDSSELQEITLPEKSKVDLDDDAQIGFVPEENIDFKTEEFDDIIEFSKSDSDLSSNNQNQQEELLNNNLAISPDYSERNKIDEEKIIKQFDEELEIESKEKAALLEEINLLNAKIIDLKEQSENYERIIQEKQESLNELASRINNLTADLDSDIEVKKNLLIKLDNEIEEKSDSLNSLIEEKHSELNRIVGEIEEKTNVLNVLIKDKQSELDRINSEIEAKSLEFQQLENLENSQLKQTELELTEKIQTLKSESEDLERIISEKIEKKNQIEAELNNIKAELELKIEVKKVELFNLEEKIRLKQEESKKVDENNALLIIQTEKQLKEKILELDSIIEQKTKEISNLDTELKVLSERLENKKLESDNWEKENRIYQENIQKSKDEIAELELKIIEVHTEAKDLLNTKNEIYSEILKLQEELKELKSEKEKNVELIQLSQKRREEIEFSNDQLEKRLLRMIEKFDNEIKELSAHKANIEKKITELENKITDNENIINDKLNKLKETEDKLRLRQSELNSINSLISNLNEKEDLLSKSISDYEKEILSKRTDNQELRKDIDLLTQKKSSIEKILEELFISSEQRISRLRETHFKTETEIRNKELLYEEINQKIEKAIDELVELQKSIHAQKIELEDLDIKSENLRKLNESLEKEIENNNRVLEQFKKMKDEISDGSNEIRKDFSKEFGINNDEFSSDPNQKKIFRL